MLVTTVERYTEFLETLPDAVLLIDAQATIVFANARVQDLLDYHPEDLTGRPIQLLVPERYRVRCQDLVAGCLAGTKVRRLGDQSMFFGRRRDGREIPVEVTLVPREVGESAMILCVLRDMGGQQHLRTLAALGTALRHGHTRANMIGILLDELLTLVDAAGATLIVRIPDEDEVLIEAASGAFAPWAGHRLPAETAISAQVIATGVPFVTDAVAAHATLSSYGLPASVRSLAIIPVQVDEDLFGALGVGRGTPFLEREVDLLRAVGEMVAIALQRMALHEELVQNASAIEDAYEDMLAGWARALDRRERIEDGHSERVTDLALRLARALGVAQDQLPHLRRGALLHDIGKIVVPDQILHKPGPLDAEEQAIMRRHTEYAYDLLGPIDFLRPALEIPYFHHERWDGTGYPRGLKGEEIPLAARIFAVADVFDAMASDRPYQLALPPQEALDHVVEESGGHFDPLVVDALVSLMDGGRAPLRSGPQPEARPEERL